MTATLMETRVCDSKTLIRLCKQADKYEFNRRVITEILEKEIDPDAINVLALILPYHRASFGPSREPFWPDHHRCQVATKIINSNHPEGHVIELWLDIAASDWDDLTTYAEFERRMMDPISMAVAAARAAADEEDDD